MQFTLIVPPRVETALTGFVGAGSRDYRGKIWRADLYAGESVRLSCNGKPVSLESAPRHAIELARAALQAFQPVKGGN